MIILKNKLFYYISYTIILILIMGLPTFIFYSIGVLAPILIQEFSIDKSIVGFLSMGTFACASLVSLWAGNIIEYLGIKKCIFILFLCVFISFIFLIFLKSFVGIVIALLFCGVGQSLSNPITNIIILQRIDDKFKSIIIGIKQSGLQIFALLAGLFIPFIIKSHEWQFSFISLLPIVFILMIFTPVFVKENNIVHKKNKLQLIKPNKQLCLLMLTQMCVGMTLSAFVTYIGIFAISLKINSSSIGSLISLYGIAGIISRVSITSGFVKFKNKILIFPVLIFVTIVVFIILMFANEYRHWPIWFAPIGIGLTSVGCNAVGMSLLLQGNRFGQAIYSSGLLSSANFLGYMLGPIFFGIIQLLPTELYAGWLFIILILLIAFSTSITLYRSEQNEIFHK